MEEAGNMRGGESMGNLMGGVAGKFGRKTRKGQGGFTLLDLSVSMIVIGLIGAGALQTYRMYAETKDYGNTHSTFGGIQTAMANFYYDNGFYPCPADLTRITALPCRRAMPGCPRIMSRAAFRSRTCASPWNLPLTGGRTRSSIL